jgi:methyltransferase (TIGR00027 family)
LFFPFTRAEVKKMSPARIVYTSLVALSIVSRLDAVEPGLPSKTSVWIACARAIGAKNPDPELRNPDYLAAKFLGPRERALLPDYPMDALDLEYEDALRKLPGPGIVTSMVIRTRYIDTVLDSSLRDGVRQVVVLGAGFDSRGYRFQDRLKGVRFIEVDYGPTQEYKQRRIKEVLGRIPKNLRYVPMDFTKDDLLALLRKGGFSATEKTLFIWEGVVVYIPEAAVKGTLQFVRRHSAADSRIVFNYVLSDFPELNNPNSRTTKWGEPMIFGFPGDSASEFVREAGLEVISDLKFVELAKQYAVKADGTSSLPMLAEKTTGSRSQRMCYARVPGGL